MKSSSLFADRTDAATQLAERLREYQGRKPLILAIPRGAVPMGRILAEQLGGELDVLLVHKLGAPFNPEFAIGSIDETGHTYFTSSFEDDSGALIEQLKSRQLAELKARRIRYTPFAPPIEPVGRVAIVVDDGLATGATMMAALHAVRRKKPAELVCAVPVAAADSMERIEPLADKVVCLHVMQHFGAVSRYYRHFSQVEDDEVTRILVAARKQGTEPAQAQPEDETRIETSRPVTEDESSTHEKESHMPMLTPGPQKGQTGRYIIRSEDPAQVNELIEKIRQDPAIEVQDVIGPAGQPHTVVASMPHEKARLLEGDLAQAKVRTTIEPDRPLSLFDNNEG
jgi:predicted phosphoribosyltransferase